MRSTFVALLAGLSLAVVAASCLPPDEGGEGPARVIPDGGADGFGVDSGSDATDDDDSGGSVSCDAGQSACNGTCVDLQTNVDHCGACGNACEAGGTYCGQGTCKCLKDNLSLCEGACINFSDNEDHCGKCGHACGGSEKCEDGTCKTLTQVEKVVEETNNVRSTKTDCGDEGVFSATHDLQGNDELHEAAQKYAETMAKNRFLSHTYRPPDCNPNQSSDCHDFAWRIRQTNYQGQPVGENIARGQPTAKAVVQGWKRSDGHCRNMMNPRAKEIGVGYATTNGGRPYWVQVFGR